MTSSDRNGTGRGDTPCMQPFRDSTAPDEVRQVLQEMVAELRALQDAAVADESVQVSPAMLLRLVHTVEAPTLVSLDLLRLLAGWGINDPAHGRARIGGALRDKRRQLGRDPTDADFPSGHAVPVMAWAYWGGVGPWAAGAPGRMQAPKHHWRDPANQETALRNVAARFPGEPITHALLHRAGYHALATALSAANLAALAARLGLNRALAKRPNGWWTAERLADAYAVLCRAAGVTLSSHALALMGGLGCTVRAQAAKRFGCFRVFQADAAARHPDLRPPERPTAKDGTALGSWQEVVVYHAIRAAFPDVAVQTQIVLPDSGGRSCDLVLADGRAWVEVLGVALAAMKAPGSAYQQAYAERWAVKQAIYAERGMPLVVVEPADVADPVRLAACMATIAVLLDRQAPPVPNATGRTIRCKGDWTFDFLCRAVAAVAAAVGSWPTNAQLIAHDFGQAVQLLKQPDMAARVSAAIGVPLRNRKGQWTAERVKEALAAWVERHGGQWPTHAALVTDGKRLLAHAVKRHFGNQLDALRAEIGRRCGLDLPPTRMPDRSYTTQESCAALLRPLCDELGRFPGEGEMAAAGLPSALYGLVSKRWGVREMAKFMGVPHTGKRAWNRASALAAFQAALPKVADLVTGTECRVVTCPAITRTMGSNGLSLMQKWFGTIAGLRAALNEADGQAGKENRQAGKEDGLGGREGE